MVELNNSDVLKSVIKGLFTVAGRRTLGSYASTVLKIVIKKLEPEFNFLRFIELEEVDYSEGGLIVNIDPDIESVDPMIIGEAIDSIIRVVYMDLEDEAGVYFISEFKEVIGDRFVVEIDNRGVNLDLLQKEQHDLFNLQDKSRTDPSLDSKTVKKEVMKTRYNWNDVSTWKYDDNLCFLYDGDGNMLEKLYLDLVIEDYVNRVAEMKETPTPETTVMELNDKEEEFLQMLFSRDLDIESAVVLLHISKQKLDHMIHKLLEFEMLQYSSHNEVKLTEKGIDYLKNIKEDK